MKAKISAVLVLATAMIVTMAPTAHATIAPLPSSEYCDVMVDPTPDCNPNDPDAATYDDSKLPPQQITVHRQMQTWTHKYSIVPPLGDQMDLSVTYFTYYFRWDQPSGVASIAPFAYDVCYDISSNPKSSWGQFDGIKGTPTYFDDNESFSPAGVTVPFGGGIPFGSQNCIDKSIKVSTRKWLEMGQSPATKAHGSIVYRGFPDVPYDMYTTYPTTVKYFHPVSDDDFGKEKIWKRW